MLYWQMFDPDHVPAEAMDDNGVFFPTDEQGFDEMIEEWEAADRAALEGGQERPFYESFGFRR